MRSNFFYKLEQWLPPQRAQKVVILYVGFIYATLPIMRPILNFLKGHLGKSFSLSVYLLLLLVAIGLIFLFLKQKGGWKAFSCLIGILVTSAYLLTKIEYPEERVHFLEYAALGVLLYFAMREWIKGRRVLFYIPAFVFLIGLGDELIQGILPNRVYDPRDILMNFVGGILGELILIIFNPGVIKILRKRAEK